MRKIIESLGFYVGTVIGAGMFALPYAVSRAGFGWSFFFFIFTFFLLTFFHLVYGKVAYSIAGKHRLPGHVRAVLGEKASFVSMIATMIGLFVALLVYGILAGIFLRNITSVLTPFYWTIIFFAGLAPFLFFRLERVGFINFAFSVPIVLFVILLFVKALPLIRVANFVTPAVPDYLLPYGVFLFAFAGLSAIPEMVEVARKRNHPTFSGVIMSGSLLIAIIYALFVAAVLGVAGSAVAPDALSTLPRFFGRAIVVAGEFAALFAVLTSYLAIGVDIRGIFHYDYGFSRWLSWLFAASVPFFLFLIGFGNFINTIEFLGAVTVALNGIFVLWLGVKKNIISRALALPIGLALLVGIGLFVV